MLDALPFRIVRTRSHDEFRRRAMNAAISRLRAQCRTGHFGWDWLSGGRR